MNDRQDEIVTVYKVHDPAKAEIIKIMLQDNGIQCELDDETQSGFVGALDIGIMVRQTDAEKAMKLIYDHFENHESTNDEDREEGQRDS